MASIQKTARGYRAQIKLTLHKNSPLHRESQLFSTKREAVLWTTQREIELKEQALADPRLEFTLRMALRRYANEISPTKKGERWERVRLSAFENYTLPLDTPY